MKIFLIAVSALILLASPLSAAEQSGTLEQIKESGTIRLGYRESEPPMSFVDESGKPVGYSIDLCRRIATAVKAELKMPEIAVELVPVNAANRFTALSDNKIDILCGSTTKTLSRSEIVDFTQLTFVTGASLLSLDGSKVAAVADLQGKKVGVVKGTTTIEVLKGALKDSLTEAEVVPVDSASDAVKSLLDGKIDAFSSDQVVLIGLVLTSEDKGDLVISNELFSFEPFALAVRRNDADFRLVADRVLSHLYRSGQIIQIYKKWFGQFSNKAPAALGAVYRLNATPE
ncbi:MAG: amino acid ABC transporter substrate-binding protein [Rhodospirillales bacterium]|nr:amino acid ABC transporter substrate-binding protein [Rhodospirillales bacterium]MDH3910378.1 amino acid ABC transporter substrate-binding protein [Rhodospirillales bacterium]MDH3917109.1 amino acid ABC transporter substrate-binding protein [Rhodospirillales bacterium]MDH3966868.1 amino acid ABC transporter substrate-binding protein [Rhodospirillales bacterium]